MQRILSLWFKYEMIDFSDMDGERPLLSEEVADNVIAMLERLYEVGRFEETGRGY